MTENGTLMRYHDMRPTTASSVFGTLHLARPHFRAPGHTGCYPLDTALSVPVYCSNLLRECVSDVYYRKTQAMLQRVLGLSVSLQSLESQTAEAASDGTTFYQQSPEQGPEAHQEEGSHCHGA